MTEVFDASDPKAVKEAVKAAKSKDTLAKEGLKAAMQSEAGRAWLYKLLMLSAPGRNAFSSDPLDMAFRCGEQNIGQQIIAEMDEVSPELYLQMMKENR